MEEEILEKIIEIAHECGDYIKKHSPKGTEISEKTSPRNLVTRYDINNQDKIINYLSHNFPQSGFVSEEKKCDIFPDNDLVFVIDPIDGTTNFVKDMQHSCISIACFKDKCPLVGCVYDPYKMETFSAIRGKGAFCNNVAISVAREPIDKSLVIVGLSSEHQSDKAFFEELERLSSKSIGVRITGSAALDICYVASGRAALFIQSCLSLWDYAAASLILSEAGGKMSDLDGNPLPYDLAETSFIAKSKDDIIKKMT